MTETARASRFALQRIAATLGGWLDESSGKYAPVEALSLILGVWATATARDVWEDTMRGATRPADYARLFAPALAFLEACQGPVGDAQIAEAIRLVLPDSHSTESSVGSSRRDARSKLRAELGVNAGVDEWLDLWPSDEEGW